MVLRADGILVHWSNKAQQENLGGQFMSSITMLSKYNVHTGTDC